MSTQFYWQQFEIPSQGVTLQNADALAPDFVPFICSDFESNAEGEGESIEVSFPIGTFTQARLESFITDAIPATIRAFNSDYNASTPISDWVSTGVVTDASITLVEVTLVIGSPLRPVGNGDAPGMVPFRSLTTVNAGKLPITSR